MSMNLCPVDWKNQLKRMNKNVDEYNGKSLGMVNVWYQKVRWFLSNDFWKSIGCLISAPVFGLGDLMLWDK